MFVSRVPLTEFYGNMLEDAGRAGYKVIVTSVAREADAPALYADVKRYWTSLHDATGPNILFVLAGKDASDELGYQGLPHRREPVIFSAADAAVATSYSRQMHWSGSTREPSARAVDMDLRTGHPILLDNIDPALEHTLQITALRIFLGIEERRLPCLAFRVLGGTSDLRRSLITSDLGAIVRTTTIYEYMRQLAGELQEPFEWIDGIQLQIADFRLRKDPVEVLAVRIGRARADVRASASTLRSAEAREAVSNILKLSGADRRTHDGRAKCFDLYRVVLAVARADPFLRELQRVIDLSHRDIALNLAFDNADECVTNLPGIQAVRKLESEEHAAWLALGTRLRAYTQLPPDKVTPPKWDFFLAYSSEDGPIAERLHSLLSETGRSVFLDRRCLLPGDRWTRLIPEAQAHSRSSIILVTRSTPQAWFSESEYLRAIDLMRRRVHIVLPLLYGEGVVVPYGLEQIQAIRIDSWGALDRAAELLSIAVSES